VGSHKSLGISQDSFVRMCIASGWLYGDLISNEDTVLAAMYETVKEYDMKRKYDSET
jgi:hypothetical protein